MGHDKNQSKFEAYGFLADHYPEMAKLAIALAKKGDKATDAEKAKLRSLAGWNTRYAKKAGFATVPVSNSGPDDILHYSKGIGTGAVHVRVKPVSMAKAKPEPVREVKAAKPSRDGIAHTTRSGENHEVKLPWDDVLLPKLKADDPVTAIIRDVIEKGNAAKPLPPEAMMPARAFLDGMSKRIRLADELGHEVSTGALKAQAALAKAVHHV
jgi:hypothetical protein